MRAIKAGRQGIHSAAARCRADRRGAAGGGAATATRCIYRDPAMENAGAARRAGRARPTPAMLITGESGTGKEVLARYIHRKSRRAKAHVHLGQLRGDPREPARKRTVRPREGRVHRRRRPPHRQVRGSQRRHAAARRNQRDASAPPGEAAARDPGARDRPRRRHAADQGRYPPDRDLQPRPRSRGAQGQFPRGPLFPPQRRQPPCAAAARAAARHRAAGRLLRQEICRGERAAAAPPVAGACARS